MRRPSLIALLLLLAAPLLAADDGPTLAQRRAHDFEHSLFGPPRPDGNLLPLPEETQRPLFEGFVKTLKTREEKLAFLDIAGGRYVYAANPVVFTDYAVPLLKDDDAVVRLAAITSISASRNIADYFYIRGPKVDATRIDAHIEAVAALLKDPDEAVRAAAFTGVGLLHGDRYLDALVAALDKDGSDAVRAGAVAGLLALASEPSLSRDARRLALSSATNHLAAGEKQIVLKALITSVAAMPDLDTRSFADAVAPFLADKDLRVPAIRALASLNSSPHAAEVAALAFGEDTSAQSTAAEALSVIATREQIPTLLKLLETGGGSTRDYASKALDRLDARDQRAAVERASQAELRDRRNGTAATTLLHKWDTPQK